MPQPDFLIVGAPKCGTTALWKYLQAHPEIWLCPRKDLHFFGTDLHFNPQRRPTRDEYLDLFSDAQGKAIGEVSVWYLLSRTAAQEIHNFNPAMRILIMLRNPVDMIHAHYTQMCFNRLGEEDQPSFEQALAKEQARRDGRELPKGVGFPQALLYREIGTLAPQVERYLQVFPRDQVQFIVQEEMQADTASTYRQCLEFLGVDPNFETSFVPVNTHKAVRSDNLRSMIGFLPSSFKRALPAPLRLKLRRNIRRWNSIHMERPSLSEGTRQELEAYFRPDRKRLESLLGRSLEVWQPDTVDDPGLNLVGSGCV